MIEMLQPWNDTSILPPPVSTFLCNKKVDVAGLRHACSNIVRVLNKQSPLHQESALCSRFLYKYDKKFRNDIGYRNLKKVNTALKKYLTLNLLKDIEHFLSALPSEDDDELYLPTRQMLQYILLRLIAFSQIMLRVCVCSKQAAIFYLDRIKRGESHWMSLLPFALLCRIWSMVLVLIQHSTTWYSNLYAYINKLELKGVLFLPDEYELPKNLEQFLDMKNIDSFGRFSWSQRKSVDVDTNLIDDEDGCLFDNILNFVNKINNNDNDEKELEELSELKPILEKIKLKEELQPTSHVPMKMEVDHGEVISRDNFKLFNTKSITTDGHLYMKVTNSHDLKQFIDTEDKYRNESDSRSSTSHLSMMQWHALKNAALKLQGSTANRKIEKKFQLLWKERCLDYME